MKDNNPGVVHVTLKGKKRALKYSLGAFHKAQQRYDIRVTYRKLADPSPADVPNLLFVGLLEDYPKIKPHDVVKIVEEDEDFDRLQFIGEAIPVIAEEALGVQIEDEDADPFEQPGEEVADSPLD